MDKRSRKRALRIAEIVVSIAIVVGIFAFASPKFASYGDVWAAVQKMTWLEIATLVGISVFNIATYWPLMVASMPGLTFGQAAVNNQSSSSIANTLPGGGLIATGITYTMYRSWGFTNTQIGLTALITGIWNAFVKLAMPVMALAALAITGQGSTTLVIPALIGLAILLAAVALFAGVLWKKSLARAIGGGLGKVASLARRVVRKPSVHWGEAAVRFRKQTLGLLSRRWPALTISALVSHFSLYLVLLLALRHVGVSDQEVGWAQVLGVFAFVRLITLVPLTPGGVGLVELGYIGGLYVAGRDAADVPIELFRAQITAAVLVFRTLTYALQIPMGALTYVIWQRKRSWRKPVPTEESPETAVAATQG
ncbi:MAG TPA: YbhN family protein [Actinomycetota bacterium]